MRVDFKMNELISIIVPVYNSEKYLGNCIDSILKQTYREFELILIDDGSRDNSGLICDSYLEKDSRIKVFHQVNSGVSCTRNRGIQEATGDYIMFVDSDDYLKNDCLEVLYNNIKEYSADIVCCNSCDELPMKKDIYINEDMIICNEESLFWDYFYNKRHAYNIWAKLYTKQILKDMKFEHLKYAEDTLFIMSIYKKISKVRLITYQGYFYRNNENGAMRSSKGIQQINDVLFCVSKIYEMSMEFSQELILQAQKKLFTYLYYVIVNYHMGTEEECARARELINNNIKKISIGFILKQKRGILLIPFKYLKHISYKLLELRRK